MNKVFRKNNALNPGREAIYEYCRASPGIDGVLKLYLKDILRNPVVVL